MVATFLEVERTSDVAKLVPIETLLAEVPEFGEIKKEFEAFDAELNKDNEGENFEQRKIRIDKLVSGRPSMLKALLKFSTSHCKELVTDAPKVFEEVCHVLFYFLSEIKAANEAKEQDYFALADFLTQTSPLPDLQLEMLSILLNLVPACIPVEESRCEPNEQEEFNKRWGECAAKVFQKILLFAIKNKRGDLFRGRLNKDLFLKWYVDEELFSELLKQSYTLLKQTRDASDQAHQFLLEYLKKKPSEKNLSFAAVVAVLTSEKNSPRGLMEVYSLDAVKQLRNDANLKICYTLLDLVYQGNVQEFKEFVSKPEIRENLEILSLDQDMLLFKIQQLTLLNIGREQPNQDIASVIKRLECDSLENLEKIVEAATCQGLIEALFDYKNQQLEIQKVGLRTFTNAESEWESLAEKLDQWATQSAQISSYCGQQP